MFTRCAIFLTSKIANQEKIHFFFELFNFNNKGYLYESEIVLMLLAITRGTSYTRCMYQNSFSCRY